MATSAAPRPNAFLLAESPSATQERPQLLSRLSPKEREMVLRLGQRKVIERGKPVFTQGEPHDGIYLVESGLVKVFYTAPSGREITLAYWYPGNFVGGPDIYAGGAHIWSGIAARTSSVLALKGQDLRLLIERFPGLALGVIDGLVFKGKCYSALAQMLGTRSVTERLFRLLDVLCDIYGIAESDGLLIGAAFSHEDLAHMVGATRQWVTVSLNRLGEQGIVRLPKGRIVVLDRAALRDGRAARAKRKAAQ